MRTAQLQSSGEAVALGARCYAPFNAGHLKAMLACLSEDVVHDINQGKRETGKHEFASFMQHMERCYREQLRDVVVMANQGGTRPAAEFVVHGQNVSSDAGLPDAADQKYIRIADGKITRVTYYYNLPDWMAQVIGTH